jgi:hypothetical protein
MRTRTLVTGAAAALALSTFATPAVAMHVTPGPVDDMAPSFSGHYSTPDTGEKGVARPWEAGPSWNR